MFEEGKSYWFKIKGNVREFVSIKGKVLEENQFFVKIQKDDGQEEILIFAKILDVNPVFEKPEEAKAEM